MKWVLPSAMRISMKPPPPKFPACGCTTASAKPTATAASTAFPPAFMICTPTREADALTLATMARGASTGTRRTPKLPGTTDIKSKRMNSLQRGRMRLGLLEASPVTERESNLRESFGVVYFANSQRIVIPKVGIVADRAGFGMTKGWGVFGAAPLPASRQLWQRGRAFQSDHYFSSSVSFSQVPDGLRDLAQAV